MRTSLWPARARSGVLVVVVAVLAALIVPAVPAAHADAGMESQFVAEINRERAAVGLSALSTAGDLVSVARAHSGVMADANNLHHNPNLGSDVTGWKKVGENVGRGPSVSALHSAFMASPGHKANVLDDSWTQVGVGVVVRDGTVWVTVVFRLPKGASAPPPPPEPEPEPEASGGSSGGSSSGGSSSGGSSSGGSAGSGGSGGSASASGSGASQPAPVEEPEEEPAEPEPHEVVDQPLPLDRVTMILAREEAAERSLRLQDVLG